MSTFPKTVRVLAGVENAKNFHDLTLNFVINLEMAFQQIPDRNKGVCVLTLDRTHFGKLNQSFCFFEETVDALFCLFKAD